MAPPHRSPARDGGIPPLAGYTVLVASDRRRDASAALLEQVGARTVGIQAARSVAKPDDVTLRQATLRILKRPCHDVVVSSAYGVRAWVSAARRWGLEQDLVAQLAKARLLARDAAAADSLRAIGLTDIFSTDGETTEELLRFLLAQPLSGRRIAVQTARLSLAEPCASLRAGGADVIEVPTFIVAPPVESYSARRLADLVVRRQVDALALVGAGAATHVFGEVDRQGRLAPLLQALHEDVLCASLGPLPGHGGLPAGLPALVAARPFPEELAETLLAALPPRALAVRAAGHRLEVRGHAVVLDGRLVPVQSGPLAVLRALAHRQGEVLSSAQIRAAIPHQAEVDDHAVEMAVSRLRQALRDANLVQTIVKHGYTLAQ